MYYDKKSRRLFLQNAAGLLLAIPVLPSALEGILGVAEAEEVAGQVKAFIFARTYYGIYPNYRNLSDGDNWKILQSSPNIRSKRISSCANHHVNAYLETSLYDRKLEEYATMVYGTGALFSTNHFSAPFLGACSQTKDHKRMSVKQSTIDVLLQEHFEKTISRKLKAIRVRPGGSTGTHSKSFSIKYNSNLDTFSNNSFIDLPSAFYSTFFASLTSGSTGTGSISKEQIQSKSAIDLVLKEYNQLKNKVSYNDKLKLEEYADEINEVSKSINDTAGNGSGCSKPSDFGKSKDAPINVSESYKTMNSLITHAISCGITKVVCIDLPHYQEKGSSAGESHGFSHGGRNNALDTNTANHLKGLKFARDNIYDLASKLKNTKDSDGQNLLHKSILLHGSEMDWEHVGDGGLSILMLGNANGQLNSGNIFDYHHLDAKGDTQARVGKAGSSPMKFSPMGWASHGTLLESFLSLGGVKRSSYLLPNQMFYGEFPTDFPYNLSKVEQFYKADYRKSLLPYFTKLKNS